MSRKSKPTEIPLLIPDSCLMINPELRTTEEKTFVYSPWVGGFRSTPLSPKHVSPYSCFPSLGKSGRVISPTLGKVRCNR